MFYPVLLCVPCVKGFSRALKESPQLNESQPQP